MTDLPVDISAIRAAAARIEGHAVRTPLLTSPALDEAAAGRIFFKAEPLQGTGSFKFRGAYNTISQLSSDARGRGIVAYSSGNHAQAVAYAARLLGCRAVIVMPSDAPRVKIEQTRAYGGEVVLYDRARQSREDLANALAADRGLSLVKPFDDPRTIAGQGTVGLEIAAQLEEVGATADCVLIPCGGGGLIAGCAIALHASRPDLPVYAVEPAGLDDTARSLAAGSRRRNEAEASSICDALLAPEPGEITFEINRRHLAGGVAVGDRAVEAAIAAAFRDLKLVVEPGGAIALAALLSGVLSLEGRCAVVVLSGGNIDPDAYAEILRRASGGR